MNILLPFENNISSIEEKLDFVYINDLKVNFTSREMSILLPKFKFELGYELNDVLMDLGMPTAFSDVADFSGMTDSVPLKIDSVMHQSFIEVNEKGTEAAAATVVSMAPTSAATDFFFANHPFIFFIEHKATGQILFMGKVENPAG